MKFAAASLFALTAAVQAQGIASADGKAVCTVTSVAGLSAAISACNTIQLQDLVLPGGVSLNLTGIRPGTSVVFAGKTTFEYADRNYPLIFLNNATNISVSGAAGSVIDGNGNAWVCGAYV